MGWLSDAWDDVTDSVSDAWDDITDAAGDAIDWIGDAGQNIWDNAGDIAVDVMTGDLAGSLNTIGGGSENSFLGDISSFWDAAQFDNVMESIVDGQEPGEWWNALQEDSSELFAGRGSYADYGETGQRLSALSSSVLPLVGAIIGGIYYGPGGAAAGSAAGEWMSGFSQGEDNPDWMNIGKNAAIAAAASWAGGKFGAPSAGGTESIGPTMDAAAGYHPALDVFGAGNANAFAGGAAVVPGSVQGADDLLDRVSADQWFNLASASVAPLVGEFPTLEAIQPEVTNPFNPMHSAPGPLTPTTTGMDDALAFQKLKQPQTGQSFDLGKLLALGESNLELPNLLTTGDEGLWQV